MEMILITDMLFNFSAARKVENVAVVAPTSSPDTFIRSSPDFRRSSPDKPTNVSLHSENTYANEDPGR